MTLVYNNAICVCVLIIIMSIFVYGKGFKSQFVSGGGGGGTQSLQKSTKHIFGCIYTLGGCPYVRPLRTYVRTYVFVEKNQI